MPAKHTLHVALTEPLIRYVRELVAAGHHATASDVVRESLRAHRERHEAKFAETFVKPDDVQAKLG